LPGANARSFKKRPQGQQPSFNPRVRQASAKSNAPPHEPPQRGNFIRLPTRPAFLDRFGCDGSYQEESALSRSSVNHMSTEKEKLEAAPIVSQGVSLGFQGTVDNFETTLYLSLPENQGLCIIAAAHEMNST
jgi:hypothetical protein